MVDLSIIIVNWNSVKFLQKCLASVYDNPPDCGFEILVLDNASYDGSAELLAREFSAVKFIQSEQNLGFAAGNNLACERALGRVLLFLNSDTEIVGTALQDMFSCVESAFEVGAVGPKLLNSDRSIQASCLQSFPSLIGQLVDTAYLRTRFPTWPVWGNRALFEEHEHAVSVDGIVGASLMIRRDVFEEIGGFSTSYFMYVEDMDLCYRLKHSGKTNYYVGTATVIHYGGQSSSLQADRQFTALAMHQSLLTYMNVHHGRAYAILFRLSTGLIALCRLSLLTLASCLPVESGRGQSLAVAIMKWRRVFRWAIGSEADIARS